MLSIKSQKCFFSISLPTKCSGLHESLLVLKSSSNLTGKSVSLNSCLDDLFTALLIISLRVSFVIFLASISILDF